MGRLIDADICLNKAWQNFYKQEDEHEKNIDDYDILRDRFYEQSGFECCQQTIVNTPTVEAIPKVEYEARLNADMVAMMEELQSEIEEKATDLCDDGWWLTYNDLIQQKINSLKESEDEVN